jgi:DNA-directed RNA polymerase specialized sigma subunit
VRYVSLTIRCRTACDNLITVITRLQINLQHAIIFIMKKTKLQEIQEVAAKLRFSEHGMSQIEMAKQIGISESYLSLVLHGERPITAIIYDYFMSKKK